MKKIIVVIVLIAAGIAWMVTPFYPARNVAITAEKLGQKPPRQNPMILSHMSTTNQAFQKWGKEFGLSKLNEFLARIPFYGVNKQFRPDEVVSTSILEPDGVLVSLNCKVGSNITHTARFRHGTLMHVEDLMDSPIGMGHNKEKKDAWEASSERWNTNAALKRAVEYMTALGSSTNQMDGVTSKVREESFPLSQGGRVYFYRVELFEAKSLKSPIIDIQFRHDGSDWKPVYWFNTYRKNLDAVSTDFNGLWKKYFKDSGN